MCWATLLSSMWKNLLFGFAYFSSGYIGMLLALPPANASPVWPPAGIALAGLLLCKNRVIPGLIAGAFAIQFLSFADTTNLADLLVSLAIGTLITSGSILQAWLGVWLIDRFIGRENPLIEDNHIIQFFLLGGPVSCLVGATVGVTTLMLHGVITADDFLISWCTWWIGDSIGVLIVAPLALSIFCQPRKLWIKRRNYILPPYILLILTILLIFDYAQDKEFSEMATEFDNQAVLFHDFLDDLIQRHIETGQTLKALFDSSMNVTEDEFERFAFHLYQRNPSIQALEWVPKVTTSERNSFEKVNLHHFISERQAGNQIIPAREKKEYFPILYIIPHETNERAKGFDISSNPNALQALNIARTRGVTAVTKKLWLVQDNQANSSGIVLYTPVFNNTPHESNNQFKGVIANVLRIENEVRQAISRMPGFNLLLELKDNDNDEILFSNLDKLEAKHDFSFFPSPVDLTRNIVIHVANRLWLLSFQPSQSFINEHLSWTLWWIILGGFMFTGFMGMGLLVMTGRTAFVEKQVETQTEALQSTNTTLKQEILRRIRLENEQNFRNKILEMLSSNASLNMILEEIAIGTEQNQPNMVCSILLLKNENNTLVHGAAPSLPAFYAQSINGISIGNGVGSCGTAAFTGKLIIVENIQTHPFWSEYQDLIKQTNLKACWSQPIFSTTQKVLGTFAIFHDCILKPDQEDIEFVARMAQLAGLAIEHKRDEEELRIAATTFESHEAIMVTDAKGSILRVNHSFTEITGFSVDEVIGKNPRILSSGLHDKSYYQHMFDTLKTKSQWQGEVWNRKKNGETYPEWQTITAVKDGQGNITHYVAIFSDISEKKVAEKEIHQLAFYDPLTGLANRRLLVNRLEMELKSTKRQGLFGSLLFLDLDRFKTINDSLGHHIGDALLIQIAERIKQVTRDVDTACRLGGDEFVVLIACEATTASKASNNAAIVADKISQVLEKPFNIEDHELHCSSSIGITTYPDTTLEPLAVLQQADTAMYRAKEMGRSMICFFKPSMQEAANKRLTLEKELKKAIDQQQFVLHYQPQYDDRGRIVSAEALLRWNHPHKGLIAPNEFIPVCEDNNLILPIGNWIINQACKHIRTIEENGYHMENVAINVSSKQFRQETFTSQIIKDMEYCGCFSNHLMIELTENVLVENIEDTVKKMHILKELGIDIAIDDFGTGYSSLMYLKRLPLSQLKIDRSFVKDIKSSVNDQIIIKTIIEMARSLGLEVLAEGVENRFQLDYLKTKGCFKYQGYYFQKPLPFDQLLTLLNSEQEPEIR